MFRLYLFGELLNHFGILNIPALSGHRHQQVLANQPGNQLRFARVQAVQFRKLEHVLCAQHRVVAAASFGNIMEQRGDKNELRLAQTWPEIHTQWVALTGLFFGKTFQLQHHANRVFVHRVSMEQVKLHLPDNP